MLAVNAACVLLDGPMKLRRRCSAKARTVFVTAVADEETAVAAAVVDASPRASVRKKQKQDPYSKRRSRFPSRASAARKDEYLKLSLIHI